MKKCQFCSEEIQNEAIKCKHCGSDLPKENNINAEDIQQQKILADVIKQVQSEENKKFLKYAGIAVLGLITILFWYFFVPVALAYLAYKLSKNLTKSKRIVFAILVYLILAPFGIRSIYNSWRTPVITIIEPQGEYPVQATAALIKGSLEPKSVHQLTLNDKDLPYSDGKFETTVDLNNENNKFTIMARNNYNKAEKVVIITRIYTQEEKTEIEKKKAEEDARKIVIEEQAKKDKAAQDAKALAEQKAYEKTKAGQLCSKHPTWTKRDCDSLVNNKIWVGMTYEMLVAQHGKPRSANPSNYGSGTRMQYCWDVSSPSCFYDNNDDGIIDAYN